jgi:hypothetical protein
VAEKIGGMFGWAVDKRTIWRAAQKTAREIDFKLDAKELPQGEADGTGIDIKGIAKRGKELKVFVQYKHGGDARVAGLDLGNYNGSWNKLFQNGLESFKGFSELLLPTDGDTSILDGLKDKVRQDNLPALFMAHPASSKICFMAGCCKAQEYGVAICNCRADGDMCDTALCRLPADD